MRERRHSRLSVCVGGLVTSAPRAERDFVQANGDPLVLDRVETRSSLQLEVVVGIHALPVDAMCVREAFGEMDNQRDTIGVASLML